MPSSISGTGLPQQIDLLKQQAAEAYPAAYDRMINEWQQPGPDALWLLYAANYLFRVGEVRWAIDPLTLLTRLFGTLPLHAEQDFSKCDIIILTHNHHDHIDWHFLKSIGSLPIPWIVPEFLIEECTAQTGIQREQIIPAVVDQCIEIRGIRILPMEGHHWEYSPGASRSEPPLKGLHSVSYLLEFHNKKWYFPGDVRAYDVVDRPSVGKIDGIAAHVWLGRMEDPLSDPPQLKPFCDYFSGFQSPRLVLTYLYEVGREMKDIWTLDHAQSIIQASRDLSPSGKVEAHCTGERVDL